MRPFILGPLTVAVVLLAAPAVPEEDSQSARAFITEQAALLVNEPTSGVYTSRVRPVRGSYAPPALASLAQRLSKEAGVSYETVAYIVQRESGWDPRARNPKSTATGLLQLIRGSHIAISGQFMTKEEHFRMASDPERNLRVGIAHIKECMVNMPGANADSIWRRCHIRGHAAVGGRIQNAALHYKPKTDSSGWLARGSVALPWNTLAEYAAMNTNRGG